MRRVLVTGSRDWKDYDAVWGALEAQLHAYTALTVVHGDCPTGADAFASTFCTLSAGRAIEEPHPADWAIGKIAGPLRNQEMVNLGADICLAFPLLGSRGTRDCMKRAEAAGIKVVTFQVVS